MAAHSYQIVDSSTTFIANETPIGDIDGTNAVFTCQNTPKPGTLFVSLNGSVQFPGSAPKDYTISSGTITFFKPPKINTKLLVFYIKQSP